MLENHDSIADKAAQELPVDWRNFISGSFFLLLAIFLAYLPVLHGAAVWDDDYMLTANPVMLRPGGLWQIFFDVHAVPVFYPITTATLWLECRLFGLHDLTGYHIVNTLIHAANTILLWRLLRQLRVPGAFVAAAMFGLHPVQVESVAWITEHKNTLSALFYLTSMWGFLRYRLVFGSPNPAARRVWYTVAIVAFVLSLGAKTTACTLPAAALLIIWWKRGRIQAADIWPAIPLFAIAAAAGAFTQWIELHTTGTWNPAWSLSPLQQILVAGRAICFYAGKLIWPAGLSFAYQRWNVQPMAAWQYLFPSTVAAIIACLWIFRAKLSRGPLTAVLFFCGTLVPALGFFHVLYQRYSFVADHFQYLACAGIFALASASFVKLTSTLLRRRGNGLLICLSACLLILLGMTTAHSAARFVNDESEWVAALSVDADSPLANLNLASHLIDRGEFTEAEAHLQRAIQSNPTAGLNWAGLGRIAESRKQYELALQYYGRAVELDPNEPRSRFQFGNLLAIHGQFAAAVQQYQEAMRYRPDWAELHDNLGVLPYLHLGELDAAIAEFNEALRLNPEAPLVHHHLDEATAAQLARRRGS